MAPSPTGLLHIGTARTALFNFLFARKHNGVCVLRMEDTDKERSRPEFETDIMEGLRWLGIEWDEGPVPFSGAGDAGAHGPYRQSERSDIYERYLTKLLEGGWAYYCYCTKEELEESRRALAAEGLPPIYTGKCRTKDANGRQPQVIRFKTPDTEVRVKDKIRGTISFESRLIGDFAIAKDLRSPLYNFAVVVDDEEMDITHVIRGEDHLSNTPKQILLQHALGFREVSYAHLPLILAPDRSKMSKRYMETSLLEYRSDGFLPEAIVNFIALLGWHPKEDREVLSLKELIHEFDIARVQKGGAIFNMEKLLWMNAHYLRACSLDELVAITENILHIRMPELKYDRDLLRGALAVERTRIKTIADFIDVASFFFVLPEYESDLLQWKEMEKEDVLSNLEHMLSAIKELPAEAFQEEETLNATIDSLVENNDRGPIFWPLRVALSGKKNSPSPAEIMMVLGKDETIRRIKIAIGKLSADTDNETGEY